LRILRVGDPHVKVTNIEESERLVEFVAEKAIELKVDRIEILGDLFHPIAQRLMYSPRLEMTT
jgi:hypothetical protein